MRATVPSLFVVAALCISTAARAATLEVGPGKTYATPCAAIAAASAGDTIQVDGSGNYGADNCSWTTDNLTVEGVNGRPKIDLAGTMPSDQKGIFTIYANNATIDNFELSGSAIDGGTGPGDSNGAGIRHRGTNLTVGAPATANTGTAAPAATRRAQADRREAAGASQLARRWKAGVSPPSDVRHSRSSRSAAGSVDARKTSRTRRRTARRPAFAAKRLRRRSPQPRRPTTRC
jgi:hypothetical protein